MGERKKQLKTLPLAMNWRLPSAETSSFEMLKPPLTRFLATGIACQAPHSLHG